VVGAQAQLLSVEVCTELFPQGDTANSLHSVQRLTAVGYYQFLEVCICDSTPIALLARQRRTSSPVVVQWASFSNWNVAFNFGQHKNAYFSLILLSNLTMSVKQEKTRLL
jgi:hypothetical protein